MSRYLRRLQEEQNKNIIDIPDDNDDDVIDDDINPVVKRKKNKKKNISKSANMFDLLDELDNESEKGENDEDEKSDLEEKEEESKEKEEIIVTPKKKKKNNKKKKKKDINNQNNTCEELDEIDRGIDEVNKMLGITQLNSANGQKNTSGSSITNIQNKSILAVDARNLSTEYEMRRRFGSSVVQTERRRNPHERSSKRTSMVTPNRSWPPYNKVGIKMSPVKDIEACSSSSLFIFEHTESYQKVQFLFYDAVESLDHNNIMALLNAHPYHIDSMLQLSEICKINEDYRMAAELIERALYVFESSFHTLYNVTTGECRLEYKRAENRPFFLSLFRHIKYVGEKACYRTALEFCKVLLSLDPVDDPLCVFLLIDYYSIRSDQYDFFIQLVDEFDITRNILLLPNIAYSYALAKFYRCNDKNIQDADRALQSALISFPSLIIELMEKCEVELNTTITNYELFNKVNYITQSAPLNQLNALYVGRSNSLWKPPDVITWVVRNCLYIIENHEMFKKEIQEKNLIRESRYKSSPRNVLRHIVISDMKEAMSHLPLEVRNQAIMTHDPLPPPDSVRGYERPAQSQRTGHNDESMLSMFIQSLLPSYDPQAPTNVQAVDQHAIAAGGGEAEPNPLQDGATRLMGAMRDLLSAMTYREDVPQDRNNGDNENENQWEEEE